MNDFIVVIHNKKENKYINPAVLDGAVIEWQINGVPGKLVLKVVEDKKCVINEGDVIQVKVDNTPFFYGFIFTIKPNRDGVMEITAYDQLRYFKNKDSLIYKNKTATELVQLLANRFGVKTGNLIDTKYKIDKRIESNTTLLDMIQFALDITLIHTKKLYIIYDDFGEIKINTPDNMEVPILINENNVQDYEYIRSIDNNTYNLIKLVVEDKQQGIHKEYYAPSNPDEYAKSPNKLQWGVLQKYEKLEKNIHAPQEKANQMLQLYNSVKRSLRLIDVAGDTRVRSGSIVYVSLNSNDLNLQAQKMIVTKVSHKFTNKLHLMSLSLKGGFINA